MTKIVTIVSVLNLSWSFDSVNRVIGMIVQFFVASSAGEWLIN